MLHSSSDVFDIQVFHRDHPELLYITTYMTWLHPLDLYHYWFGFYLPGVCSRELWFQVDPYYAEYRRQRRRNRGRSLSEPEPGLLGMGKSQPKQEFILQSPPVQPGQMTMQMNQMPVMQQQMGVMNNTMNPLGSMNQLSNMNQPQVNNMSNMNQQQMGGIQTTGSIVIVADNTGFQSGSFFVTKLQTELGAQVCGRLMLYVGSISWEHVETMGCVYHLCRHDQTNASAK